MYPGAIEVGRQLRRLHVELLLDELDDRAPDRFVFARCPTLFDASQAPSGRHTAFIWEKLAYCVHGNPANWDHLRDGQGRAMLELWRSYAPNLAESVIDSFTRTPLDVERSLPNMREGDLLIGAFGHDQVGSNRPLAGAGNYRSHVGGLYLCGSSSHPGGNITGLPAYNAAQVILSDLDITADWMPASFAGRLAAMQGLSCVRRRKRSRHRPL
jgi:phytoene dehydrogenase-like protein